MKITKARLKEIINEELEAAMTPEESDAAYRAAAPERQAAGDDLGAAIAQSQEARGYDAQHYAKLQDQLLQLYMHERELYKHAREDQEEESSRVVSSAIDKLEAEIGEIKRTHDLDA